MTVFGYQYVFWQLLNAITAFKISA